MKEKEINNNWCVYKHTNLINGKIYIGKTCKKPEHRWNDGKGYKFQRHFWYAIQKYGWDNFSHEIIANNLTAEESKELEIKLIAEYDSMNPNKGYNQTAGGEGMLGWHHTEESLAKIRLSNSTRGVSEETKKKMSAIMKEKYKDGNNPFLGKEHSQKTKDELSRLAIERWQDESYKEKMLEKIKSPERNKKISDKRKEKWQDPEYRAKMLKYMNSDEYRKMISERNKGRKHTEEELKKMSVAVSGERNGMFGKRGKNHPSSKPVVQYDLEGNFIREFENAKEAEKETRVNDSQIGKCCKRKFSTAGGFIWRYVGDTNVEIPNQIKINNKPVYQFDKNANLIREYKNIEEVIMANGYSKYSVLNAAKGKTRSAHNYLWSFNNTTEPYCVEAKPVIKRIVLMFDLSGELIEEFESVEHANHETGINKAQITRCCKGTTYSANKFIFIYDDEFSEEILRKKMNKAIGGRLPRGVLMFSISGEYENSYESVKEAAKDINANEPAIYMNCNGQVSNTKLHIFIFEDEYSEKLLKARIQMNFKKQDHSAVGSPNAKEIKLLNLYKEKPTITQRQVSIELGISTKTIFRLNKSLKEKKLIERVGSYKSGYWNVFI